MATTCIFQHVGLLVSESYKLVDEKETVDINIRLEFLDRKCYQKNK